MSITTIEQIAWAIVALSAAVAMLASTFGDIFRQDPQDQAERNYYRHAGPQDNELKR